jgi:hypothetical protein
MTNSEKLRKKAKAYVESADDKSLLKVINFFQKGVNANDDKDDWWNDLPDDVQASIKRGLRASEERKGISHEEMVKRSGGWLKA